MFDKGSYDKDYAKKHITRKFIPFNDTVQDDVDLLAWLNQQQNVTQYIKQLIREDMARARREGITPDYDNPPCTLCGMNPRADWLPDCSSCAVKNPQRDYMVFPEIDGYRDQAAINDSIAESHAVRVINCNGWEVRYDITAQRVLSVDKTHDMTC